jgi:hypothetical protein
MFFLNDHDNLGKKLFSKEDKWWAQF